MERQLKEIEVTLVGVTPLLMHSAKSMLEDKPVITTKAKGKKIDYKEIAESGTHRSKNGYLFVPATAVKGAILNASVGKRFGKLAAKPIVASSVYISPHEISLKTKNYEIDIQTAVNHNLRNARVVVVRPRIDQWKLDFTISYDTNRIQANVVKELLDEAGWRAGLLSFAPRHDGDNGQFKVEKFKIKEVKK